MNKVKELMGDQLLVIPEKTKETRSTTGIISQVNDNKTFRGEVVQAGPGLYSVQAYLIPMTVKPGDTVVYKKSSANEVKIRGEKYDLIREQQVDFIDWPGEDFIEAAD